MPRECDVGATSNKASKRGPKDQNKGKPVLKQKSRFKVDLKQLLTAMHAFWRAFIVEKLGEDLINSS